MTENNIKRGFRGARPIPLDPESIISKLDVKLRTPTPVEEEASLPGPWASKTLSQRRRAKRMRLQNRGKMTVEEGREAIDQMDTNTQVQAESSGSSGRGGSARLKERRCGTWGKAGHNTKTCQIVVRVSGEEYSN
jgi:hypothetical protein